MLILAVQPRHWVKVGDVWVTFYHERNKWKMAFDGPREVVVERNDILPKHLQREPLAKL